MTKIKSFVVYSFLIIVLVCASGTAYATDELEYTYSDNLISEQSQNTFSSGYYWYRQGSGALEESNGIITAKRNGMSYTSGLQQRIPYSVVHSKTGDAPGDFGIYELSYNMMSETSQEIKIVLEWCVNGISQNEGNPDSESIGGVSVSLNSGEWTKGTKRFNVSLPQNIQGYEETSTLRVYMIGNIKENNYDFKIKASDFELRKLNAPANQQILIDDVSAPTKISDQILGFSYGEGRRWFTKDMGSVVSTITEDYKDSYIDYINDEATGTRFGIIRTGGFVYSMWKWGIGPKKERIAYVSPLPKKSTLTYSIPIREYIDIVERVKLAQAYNPDNRLVMCVNIWSAEPNEDDMTDETGTVPNLDVPYPVKIMRHLSEYEGKTFGSDETIDEDILNNAINNALDYMRFFLCEVDDPRAIGADGTNWAQKRVENGIKNPVKVYCWELGNELYIRNCSPEGYVKLAKLFLAEMKKVFPEEKYGAHVTMSSNYPNWMKPIVDGLGNDVDFITTHDYYKFACASNNVQNDKKIIEAMKATGNENLKLIITEGGLDTFQENYSGPSNKSIGICTSFADYFNNVAKLDDFDGFTYYGGSGTLVYNLGEENNVGWRDLNCSMTYFDQNCLKAFDRRAATSGFQYLLPIGDIMKSSGANTGDTVDLKIKLKYMMDNTYKQNVNGNLGQDEACMFKVNWRINGNDFNEVVEQGVKKDLNMIYNKWVGRASGSWKDYEVNASVTIPQNINPESDYLRMALYGATQPTQMDKLNDFYVESVDVFINGSSTDIAPELCYGVCTEDEYRDTPIGELLRYYVNNLGTERLNTQSGDELVQSFVPVLVTKTQNGMRIFAANLDNAEHKLSIETASGQKYAVSRMFMQSAPSRYSERDWKNDDVTTYYEENKSRVVTDELVLPGNSVAVYDLDLIGMKDRGFVDYVKFEQNKVTAELCNILPTDMVIAAFYDEEDSLLQTDVCYVAESYDKTEKEFECKKDFAKVRFFVWNKSNIKPQYVGQTYYK